MIKNLKLAKYSFVILPKFNITIYINNLTFYQNKINYEYIRLV